MRKTILKISAVILFCAVAILLYKTKIGCPILYFLKVPCAGCGLTRATICALTLNFKTAFYYHPLFFITPAIALVFVFYNRLPKRFAIGFCIVCAALFLAVYIARLFFIPNSLIYVL